MGIAVFLWKVENLDVLVKCSMSTCLVGFPKIFTHSNCSQSQVLKGKICFKHVHSSIPMENNGSSTTAKQTAS